MPTTLEQSIGQSVKWDYTEHANHYDKRADYSSEAIRELLGHTHCKSGTLIADVGAGTGKLTKELLKCGMTVRAVEPNDAMRKNGIQNTQGQNVAWSIGTGEATGLSDHSVHAAFFGSSFNVVDQKAALKEVNRILQSKGWFACMWNHRDLDDPLQQSIEHIIQSFISSYSYGKRRENPSAVINECGYFTPTQSLEKNFSWRMSAQDIIVAWKSHATLYRQAGSEKVFSDIISEIEKLLARYPEAIEVPYTTRIYFAQKKA